MDSNFFNEAKQLLSIPQLAKKLGRPLNLRRGVCRSPVREDKNPSFSVFANGTKFRDHATGDHGDIFDFYQLVTGCDRKEAINAIAQTVGMVGRKQDSLRSFNLKSPTVISTIRPSVLKQQTDEVTVVDDLKSFLKRKHIRDGVFHDLYLEGALSLMSKRMAFHYEHGTKVRHEWDSSRSCRWAIGSAGDSVWRQSQLKKADIHTVVLTEGESDCMRLLSFRPMRKVAVCAIPSASWIPSPVLSGFLANARTVVLAMDNDKAGETAVERLTKTIKENSFYSTIISLKWNGLKENDLCDCDDETLSNLLDENKIFI